MKLLKCFGFAIMLALLMSQAAAQKPQWENPDYDAVRDFSGQSNPNGVWSYGWETSFGAALTLYTDSDTTCRPGLTVWSVVPGCDDNPVLAHNDSGKTVCDELNRTCYPANYLDLHPGPNGEYSVLRWTAPISGWFMLETAFEGLDADNGGADVHILVRNHASLFSGPVNTYWVPLAYRTRVKVSAGDTVDILVGFGQNGNYYNDSTGVRFALTRLGQ